MTPFARAVRASGTRCPGHRVKAVKRTAADERFSQAGLPATKGVTVQFPGSGERWGRVAAVVRGEEFGQVVEEGAVLLAAGGGGGEGALGESFAAV